MNTFTMLYRLASDWFFVGGIVAAIGFIWILVENIKSCKYSIAKSIFQAALISIGIYILLCLIIYIGTIVLCGYLGMAVLVLGLAIVLGVFLL